MMKKNPFFTAILMSFVLVSFLSCQKNIESVDSKNVEINKSLIYAKNGMLVFPNIETFQSTMTELENAFETKKIKFSTEINGKTQEEIESYIEITKWDENLIFVNFEKQYNYTSLRSVIAKKMIEYNKIYDRSKLENPDNHYVGDMYMRTLMNEKCQVMIGTSIYKMLENGTLVEILNENFEIAEAINSLNMNNYKVNDEIKIDENECKSCYLFKGFDWYAFEKINYDGKEIQVSSKCFVSNNIVSGRYIKGSTKVEYWNNSWKYYNVYKMSVTAGGNEDIFQGQNCSGINYGFENFELEYNTYWTDQNVDVKFDSGEKTFSYKPHSIGTYSIVYFNSNLSYTFQQKVM